jgi:hypothetical protein
MPSVAGAPWTDASQSMIFGPMVETTYQAPIHAVNSPIESAPVETPPTHESSALDDRAQSAALSVPATPSFNANLSIVELVAEIEKNPDLVASLELENARFDVAQPPTSASDDHSQRMVAADQLSHSHQITSSDELNPAAPEIKDADEALARSPLEQTLESLRSGIAQYRTTHEGKLPRLGRRGLTGWQDFTDTGILAVPPSNPLVDGEFSSRIVVGLAPDDEAHNDYGWIFNPHSGQLWAANTNDRGEALPNLTVEDEAIALAITPRSAPSDQDEPNSSTSVNGSMLTSREPARRPYRGEGEESHPWSKRFKLSRLTTSVRALFSGAAPVAARPGTATTEHEADDAPALTEVDESIREDQR